MRSETFYTLHFQVSPQPTRLEPYIPPIQAGIWMTCREIFTSPYSRYRTPRRGAAGRSPGPRPGREAWGWTKNRGRLPAWLRSAWTERSCEGSHPGLAEASALPPPTSARRCRVITDNRHQTNRGRVQMVIVAWWNGGQRAS